MIPKLIYFAERHPRFDRETFRERWRQHGRLGMSLPRWRNILRYAQCDVLSEHDFTSVGSPCDGVATVVFRSEEARAAHAADPSAAITKADEGRVFARPVRSFSVLTTETVLLPHHGAAMKLFVRVYRSRNLDHVSFRSWWSSAHAASFMERLQRIDRDAGYSQNHMRPDSPALGLGLEVDCVDEISSAAIEESVELLRLTGEDRVYQHHVARIEYVAVREVVLYSE